MGEVYRGFLGGNLRKRVRLEDPGISGRIILECIFREYDIDLVEDRDRLPAMVTAVIKLWVP